MSSVSNFNDRVGQLAQAIAAGKLIDDQLQVIDKGWIWKIRCFVLTLLSPLYSCLGKDPFAHVRVNNVAQSLLKQCKENQVSSELKEKVVNEILNPLAAKTKGKYNLDIATIAGSIRSIVQVSREEKQAVLQAINNCAQQLHRKIAESSATSVCFAPLSIAAVLGMVLKAMPDERKQEFLRAMGLENIPEAKVHAATMQILDDLVSATGDQCKIHFANAVALTPGVGNGIHPSFTETVEGNYRGQIFLMENLEVVNKWVAEKTQGKIENFLQAADIPPNLIAILLNAMYFSAKWKDEFGKPFDAPFTFANGNNIPAKMIYQQNTYKLYDGGYFRMLEMPYKSPEGHELTHVIFLPNEARTLSELEGQFTHQFVNECRKQAVSQEVRVTMPKIDVNVKEDRLLSMLQEIGLPLRGALPLISQSAELSKIVHQAMLKVDEKGSEGAAVTGGLISEKSCPAPSQAFKADHDFAYFIMDKESILFQGNVRDTSALVH